MYVQQDSIPPPKKYTYFVNANIFLEEKQWLYFWRKRLEIRGRIVKEGRILLIHFLYGLKPLPHISIINIII